MYHMLTAGLLRDTRKIEPLLSTLNDMYVDVCYYALDLSKEVLAESMLKLRQKYRNVKCFGLWGTFDDCFAWAQAAPRAKCYISLGSMFGNNHFDAAVSYLKRWTGIMRSHDRMLLGLDGTVDRDAIWKSYHDLSGLVHKFITNGFRHSNVVLEADWYHEQDWEISGKLRSDPLMHSFVMTALRDVKCEVLGLDMSRGEEIICYEGFKYRPSAMHKQFVAAGLKQTKQWQSPSGRICKSFSMINH